MPDNISFIERFSSKTLPSKKKGECICAVYIIRNMVSGKFYVGSTGDLAKRLQAHVGHLKRGIHCALLMQNSWRAHGEDAFEFLVIMKFQTSAAALAYEQELISTLRPAFNTAEFVTNPMIGRRHSAETIAKIRASRKGKGLGPKVFSEAHRAAISKALSRPRPELRGQKRNISVRQKMAASARAKFANGFRHPRIRSVEISGKEYASGREAARALGIDPSDLVRLIKSGVGRYLD